MITSPSIGPKWACTFCGKSSEAVEHLIAGPNQQAICNECVALCADIIRHARTPDMIRRLAAWRETADRVIDMATDPVTGPLVSDAAFLAAMRARFGERG